MYHRELLRKLDEQVEKETITDEAFHHLIYRKKELTAKRIVVSPEIAIGDTFRSVPHSMIDHEQALHF